MDYINYFIFIAEQLCPSGYVVDSDGISCREVDCGGIIANETGLIQAGRNSSTLNCEWLIMSPDVADRFEVEVESRTHETFCVRNHFRMFDGVDIERPLVSTMCGQTVEFTTTTNTLRIIYSSDNIDNSFRINFRNV